MRGGNGKGDDNLLAFLICDIDIDINGADVKNIEGAAILCELHSVCAYSEGLVLLRSGGVLVLLRSERVLVLLRSEGLVTENQNQKETTHTRNGETGSSFSYRHPPGPAHHVQCNWGAENVQLLSQGARASDK